MADRTDTPPDRLSLDPRSPFFDEALLSRGVGIRFNGKEKTNVKEYSRVRRLDPGRRRASSRDRYGKPMTLKLKGRSSPISRAGRRKAKNPPG